MSQTLKVGIFMTVALVLLGWLILRIEDWSPFAEPGRRVDAVFDSVVGLDDRAAVRVAGVRVGRVDGVRLDADGRRARVTLLLDAGLVLTEGAEATIANQGLLGDKFVELAPGPAGAAPLPEGALLPGRTPVSFDQAMAKLEKIGDSIEGFLSDGEGGAGGGFGPLVDSIRATSDELRALIVENRASVGGTVRNFERFSATLAEELPRLTSRIEQVLGQVDGVIAENRGDLRESMANISEVTGKIQTSVDNLNEITTKIASGEGTIGKLVNSDEAHDELMAALDSVEKGVTTLGDTLGRVQKLRLDVAMESAWLSESEEARSTVRLDVLPRGAESSRFYRVDLVSDPAGRLTDRSETITVTRPDGTTEVTTIERLRRETRRYEYSALVGFPFADRRGRFWAGLIENSGGAEIDYALVPDKVWLSATAYDFARELDLDPHLRLTAKWHPFKNVYVTGGWDDLLVEESDSPFLGAGLRWTDDDLKYLFGSMPSF